MNTYRTMASRTLAVLAVAGCLVALPGAASSHPLMKDHSAAADPAARQARMRQHVEARLQRMEEKLQITPIQANAWAAYRQTIESLAEATGPTKPASDADAAAITRFRAERAAAFAQKMNQVAEATAALRQALEPEQRRTLDEMVRYAGTHRGGKRNMR